jgi:hypothetical protein
MQIPILKGIYTSAEADFRVAYPVNLYPVVVEQGISKGYLRPADGLISTDELVGADRGGILWDGVHYRVIGTKLVRVTAAGDIEVLGDVGSGNRCHLVYSFDLLAIWSGGRLYYWNKTTLTQVTDPDLGVVFGGTWVDGYFVMTDGEFIVVTDLNDPLSINILKYGSAEIDPDPVMGCLKVRNELTAVGRHTIEVYNNVGGSNFPFTRVPGAHIEKGAVGRYAFCHFDDSVAFVGGGQNEAPAVYLGQNGATAKISTAEIDKILTGYTEAQIADIYVEQRLFDDQKFLYVHLPDRTMVYDLESTKRVGEFVWFCLTSAQEGFSKYRASGFVYAHQKWWFGSDDGKVGYLTQSRSDHMGQWVRWEFGTSIMYGESLGALVHAMELVCLTGRASGSPSVSTSYSNDGLAWSNEEHRDAGGIGDRTRRIIWLRNGLLGNWRIQRFKGTSDAFLSVARLEVTLEPLRHV